MSKITGVHHVAVRASDFDRTIAFYTEVIGLSLSATWQTDRGRAAFVEIVPGSYMEIFERPAEEIHGDPPILHFCLRTDDVVAMTERARAAGYPVGIEPKTLDIATSAGTKSLHLAFVDGPDGEQVEFMASDGF
jgi:catechol 2,3-dioxygenase-like lactoylglutathione lyase family enzyme